MIIATLRSLSLCRTGVRSYARGRRIERISDPGINRRAGAFRESGVDIPDDIDLEQLLNESEADLKNINFAQKHYEYEAEKHNEQLKKNIVRQKYFNDEPMPNLLTWSEKEQIRYLATEHADEWTPERIAESFPVTPEVVKKLVKHQWKPASLERIARHDNSALRNWKQLKDGELDIPEHLRQRFLKFSDRTIPPLNEASIKPDISPEIVGEFQAIIEKSASKEKERLLLESKQNETKLIEKDPSIETIQSSNKTHFIPKRNRGVVTFDELKGNINKKISQGKDVDELEKYIVDTPENIDDQIVPVTENTLDTIKKTNKDTTMFIEVPNEIQPVKILDRIRIPKAAFKKGRTYRVNDCYYDCDGRFLYRVPGLTEASGFK